ncbi:TM2 domain-containing protein [Melghirimyces profundicolus]|uniref:TM2 domain-containing protein n=1 Tax=Melghirimyces profundicolus TaxID=1242148 RepID=A0A2T6BXK5_9BACL|nr:TM2 domain-containing protein [Melghirimyces profundicolus]PTX60811.1 TM2 domain-containing protein [Melghirimyces profundicolus]
MTGCVAMVQTGHSSENITPERDSRSRQITAYALWLFLGVFGAHRFYLGKRNSGLLMALISPLIISFGLFFHWLPGLGVSPLLVISPFLLWWGLDSLLIQRWLAEHKQT